MATPYRKRDWDFRKGDSPIFADTKSGTVPRKPPKPRRRAAILIIILVCFIVAAAMFVMLGRQAVAERRASQARFWTAQAQWIAEAAVERAAARLVADAKYKGETWTIPAAEMGGEQNAKVSIHVENVAGRPDSRAVRVEADYPDDPVHRSRCTKEIVLEERHEKSK